MPREKVRVLIVDDSASVRQILQSILNDDPDIEVMGTASDPFVAAKRLQDEIPDVMILDLEMPRMDGMTFLRKIMAQRPIPVIICSSLTAEGSNVMFEAFEAGAVDIVPKPKIDTRQALLECSTRLREAVKSAARARVRPHRTASTRSCSRAGCSPTAGCWRRSPRACTSRDCACCIPRACRSETARSPTGRRPSRPASTPAPEAAERWPRPI